MLCNSASVSLRDLDLKSEQVKMKQNKYVSFHLKIELQIGHNRNKRPI